MQTFETVIVEKSATVLQVANQVEQTPVSGADVLDYTRALLESIKAGTKLKEGRMSEVLEHIESKRISWQGNEMAASRGKLYGILTECYSIYLGMKDANLSKAQREAMAKELDLFLKKRMPSSKMQKSTHGMHKVVKAIFGDDRRRVSAYATGLCIALTAGPVDVRGNATPIPAAELSQWIKDFGGIEEVRRAANKNSGGITRQDRIDMAQNAISASPLMKFKPDSKNMLFGIDDRDKMLLLVVTYLPTGELEVNTVVRGDGPLKAALAAHYAANKDDMANAVVAAKATEQSAVAVVINNI
jgi:hypothetical protein